MNCQQNRDDNIAGKTKLSNFDKELRMQAERDCKNFDQNCKLTENASF